MDLDDIIEPGTPPLIDWLSDDFIIDLDKVTNYLNQLERNDLSEEEVEKLTKICYEDGEWTIDDLNVRKSISQEEINKLSRLCYEDGEWTVDPNAKSDTSSAVDILHPDTHELANECLDDWSPKKAVDIVHPDTQELVNECLQDWSPKMDPTDPHNVSNRQAGESREDSDQTTPNRSRFRGSAAIDLARPSTSRDTGTKRPGYWRPAVTVREKRRNV